MKAVLITEKDFKQVKKDIQEMKEHLQQIIAPVGQFIDNKTFVEMMGVSLKTAQIWRNEGKIGFSQEGKKIYYRMADVEAFLEKFHRKPFCQKES